MNNADLHRVLLIGWDAADWKVIHPLMDAGKMPHLAKLVKEGVMGNLATLSPDLSPMLWTSIVTGKRPFKHGIHGFTEPAPQGGIRPITSLSRKTRAIWNILTLAGMKSNIIGWWPSHPVEPINGVMVSNHYQRAVAPHGEPWPMRPGTVHPERIQKNLADLRIHPQDLDPALIMNFVPKLEEIDQEKDHRIENLAKIIGDVTTSTTAAQAVMYHEPWDLTAVYLDGVDHFCHGFMPYHPPRLPWVDEGDFDHYHGVVEAGYIYHDILLGRLLERTDDQTTIILVSDHGFHSDHLRPSAIPLEPAGPAAQHRPYGIFVMKGPGVKRDELVFGASLLDVCPTILTVLGLPVAEDMDGKPLVTAFESTPAIESIASWDDVAGEDGAHPKGTGISPVEAREALDQLVALGYIDRPHENAEKAAADTTRELKYNLARAYADGGRHRHVPMLVNQRFWMQNDSAAALPIAGVYLLEQAQRCYVAEDVRPAESFSKLLAVHMDLNSRDGSLVRRGEKLAKFIRHTPPKRLRFTRNTRNVENCLWGRSLARTPC